MQQMVCCLLMVSLSVIHLEDQYQAVKVMHETCIPEGTYDIKFRKTGGFHSKYREDTRMHTMVCCIYKTFQTLHTYLYMQGIRMKHTSGCLIVGETQQDLDRSEDGFIGHSGTAYQKMYKKVAGQLLQGKPVSIEYTTINKLLRKKQTDNAKDHLVLTSTVYDKLQEINGNVLTRQI